MLDMFEKRVVNLIDAIGAQDRKCGGLSQTDWTRKIKERLCRLGKSLGYGVSAAGCQGADTGEWIFDLVWADGNANTFEELPFAMECEWSTDKDQIFWDFEKLLIAKSMHKLFLFQQANDENIRLLVEKLSEAVLKFRTKIAGERYLFAGWSGHRKTFIYKVVTC